MYFNWSSFKGVGTPRSQAVCVFVLFFKYNFRYVSCVGTIEFVGQVLGFLVLFYSLQMKLCQFDVEYNIKAQQIPIYSFSKKKMNYHHVLYL